MADNKKKRGGTDRGLIALGEAYEVAYWSKKFKITPAKLKATVKKVGRSAKKVEAYIKLQAHKAADRARIAATDRARLNRMKVSSRKAVTPASQATASRIGQPQTTGETALAAAITANPNQRAKCRRKRCATGFMAA